MKCPHCGEELPEGFSYTPPFPEENDSVPAEEKPLSDTNFDESSDNSNIEENTSSFSQETGLQNIPVVVTGFENKNHHKKLTVISVLIVFAIVVVCSVSISIMQHSKNELRTKLIGSWNASNSAFSASGFSTDASLNIDENSITYNEYFGLFELNTVTKTYKVISSDTIAIDDNEYVITFKGTNSMVITPGFSGAESDTWIKENSYNNNINNNSDKNSDNVL